MSVSQRATTSTQKEHYITGERSVSLLGENDEFSRRLAAFEHEYARVWIQFNEDFGSFSESEQIYWNAEIRTRQEMLKDFVKLLRLYPQMPLKATTNTGDTEALSLDFQGMYEFFKVKVETALRCEPERTAELSEKAQELGRRYVQNAGGENTIAKLSELQIACLPGDQSSFIAQNAIYAERLAGVGRTLGVEIPSLEDFTNESATYSPPPSNGLS